MDYGDDFWGLYRHYYRDPYPHSLLSTRQLLFNSWISKLCTVGALKTQNRFGVYYTIFLIRNPKSNW